jgi:hypothetical protein
MNKGRVMKNKERNEAKWMLMVFGYAAYAECDGNERGKRRRRGDTMSPSDGSI